ncbi:hypothetical protein L227DRAFT_611365 [Lentinus tigrinus ALCF2SS1-6]|uniref:Helicase C-terminal domain-containing protein n=2 Tax=Lentinus tigrinus TaxID=5365 RepID=A0A5C2SGF7_9APHY|nr:hypothetical protein L227DRAFT_611365 [Lentinus tigrinus ALCF2SS1-6]
MPTNLVERPNAQAAGLENTEFTAGVPALMRKIVGKLLRIVCFVGKDIWDSFIGAAVSPSPSHQAAISSLVLRADRETGSRVQREVPKGLEKKKEAANRQEAVERPADVTSFGYTDIIEATEDVEGLTQALGDQANDIVRSAADAVLQALGKNENMKDFDKKEVEEILGSISNLGVVLAAPQPVEEEDYGLWREQIVDPDQERKYAEIDCEMGVAVVFDEEEEEDVEGGFEIRDESDEEAEEAAEGAEPPPESLEGNDELVIAGSSAAQQGKTQVNKDIVSPHSIDVSGFNTQPLRQPFPFIRKLVKNRDVIVWCTKLMPSDADESVNVEVAMREKGVGWMLRELAGDRKAKAFRRDRRRLGAKVGSIPKSATLAPAGLSASTASSGDSQMTKQQISETQIIVTTPEKWDVITRKSTDTNLVGLIIIDEIRSLRSSRSSGVRSGAWSRHTSTCISSVSLLPNYQDVATFPRVDQSKGDGAKTAKFISDIAIEETITQFVKPEGATRKILLDETNNVIDPSLKDLLQFGFDIHHAGMSREARGLVEELFADAHLQVLVCTVTLAWGVNLPAHTVIIKGTQINNPEKGRWVELSFQDVFQMLGRAGRPQYDTYGEGVIITNHSELQYYRTTSTLRSSLVPFGTATRPPNGLGYTYFYVRMLKDPVLYRPIALLRASRLGMVLVHLR